MNYQLHFLRPDWFWALIPLGIIAFVLLKQKDISHMWDHICDKHLLPHLIEAKGHGAQKRALCYLLAAACFVILALAGPTGTKLPRPTYHSVHPRLVIMDLSRSMLKKDLAPNRLTRAKFKLHDLFQYQDKGQFGLIVYTGEPFVVSPMTLDAQTIDALVNQLEPSIMPVGGSSLTDALKEGQKLILQSGISYGDILVITGNAPSEEAIRTAKKLYRKHIRSSVLMLTSSKQHLAEFSAFAKAGGGDAIPFKNTEADLKQWLGQNSLEETFQENLEHTVPTWRDDGRFLLIPALFCLLPVFRRFWLMRIPV